jgi:hypothetical protein
MEGYRGESPNMSLLVDTNVWSLALRRDAPQPGPQR